MYQLTPRMLQRLQRDLKKYHDLFDGGGCSGWELEELIVAAITSDTQTQHHVRWREAGHDDLADIVVQTNGIEHAIQIKSGQVNGKAGKLTLSGHRLGRFDGNIQAITRYLNANNANVITVPYHKVDGEQGRQHIYQVCYVDVRNLTGLVDTRWTRKGTQHIQKNACGVGFSLRPSMSWQIWWSIPSELITETPSFVIG